MLDRDRQGDGAPVIFTVNRRRHGQRIDAQRRVSSIGQGRVLYARGVTWYANKQRLEQDESKLERLQAIVVIMDSTEPGRLMFSEPSVEVATTASHVLVPVTRHSGADGRVSVRYQTANSDAFAGAQTLWPMTMSCAFTHNDAVCLHNVAAS